MLTLAMKQLINAHTLGFVASVSEDGQPNLSPKGTFVIVDDSQMMFAEIRSPNTLKNISSNPQIEINFIDPFARKGVRIKGLTRMIKKSDPKFDSLLPEFDQWGELTQLIRHIVIVEIRSATTMSSPIYDLGAKEPELVKNWTEKYNQINDCR